MVSLDKLLTECVQQNGSYLHIKAGRPPILRLQPSQLMEMAMPPLSPEEARAICYQALTVEQRAQFEQTLEINASYEVAGLGVFEVNLFKARGHVCGVFHFTRG